MQAIKALGTLLVLIGAAALVYLFFNNGSISFGKIFSGLTTPIHDERSFSADEINHFAIDSNSLDVHIVRSGADDIVVTLDGRATKGVAKDLKLVADENGDTLKLALQSEHGFRIGFNWTNIKLTVALPDRAWQSLTAKLNSGDIEMNAGLFDSVELQTNSGDIDVRSITASSELRLKANSGDFDLEEIKANSILLEANSGDIEMKRYKSELIEFEVNSGDVVLENGFGEHKGETKSGDIHMSTDYLSHDTSLKAGSGDIDISLTEDPQSLKVQFSTGSGDAIVRKSDFAQNGKNGEKDVNGQFGNGEIRLIAHTGSGDIILR
jgi:lia operon protein LiaG